MSIPNSYFWHTTRIIYYESRRSVSMKDLQNKLLKRGIVLDIKGQSKLPRITNF